MSRYDILCTGRLALWELNGVEDCREGRPGCEDGRFHRRDPWLRQGLHPKIQVQPGRWNCALGVNLAAHVLHAVA